MLDDSLRSFLDRLGSADPVPGGGAASALAAALAANLFKMVVALTRQKEADKNDLLAPVEARLNDLATDLGALVTRDADAYQRVRHAYQMPKDAEDQRIRRAMEIQLAMREATNVPLEVAQRCVELLESAIDVVVLGRPSAISDAGTANFLALSAAMGALLNVQVNLEHVDDDDFVASASSRAVAIQERCHACFEQVRVKIAERMGAA